MKPGERWIAVLVSLLIASIPFGAIMSIYMDDVRWLFFCVPLFIFLS